MPYFKVLMKKYGAITVSKVVKSFNKQVEILSGNLVKCALCIIFVENETSSFRQLQKETQDACNVWTKR